MLKKVIAAIALIALFAVAMVQAMDKEDKSPAKTGIEIGDKAPDFELKNLDGQAVKLSDLKGKKVILNFWATWCPPCRAEMPEMEKYYQEIKNGGKIEFLAVNLDPKADVKGFAEKMGIHFPIVLDEIGLQGTY